MIFKSLACFIINSPSTLDLFDNNIEKLEEFLKIMFSNFKEYNSAVQTDRTNKIYGTIGTISYQLDPNQEKERIRRSTQRKTHNNNNNTNFNNSPNNNMKQNYNNYKTGNTNNKTPANGIMMQCKRCYQNYIGNSETDTHQCQNPNKNQVNLHLKK